LSLCVSAMLVAAATANTLTGCARPCKSSGSKVVFWGSVDIQTNTLLPFLNDNIPAATFSQIDDGPNQLTPTVLAGYDVFILSMLQRPATATEAQTLATWVKNGGFFFGMSGFINSQGEVDNTNSYLQFFGDNPRYLCYPSGDCTISDCDSACCSSTYPNQPIVANIDPCQIDYKGGYPSVFDGPSSYLMKIRDTNIGLVVDLCNATNPSGGRYVLWGDEWITFTQRFDLKPGDKQIWFNIISYLGVCAGECQTVADCPGDCATKCTSAGICAPCLDDSCGYHSASTACNYATVASETNRATLVFDPVVNSC